MSQKATHGEIGGLNEKILKLWEKYATPKMRFPMLYPEIPKGCILFVGLNPSFSDKGFKQILSDTRFKKENPRKLYDWKRRDKNTASLVVEIEQLAKDKYAYFTKFKDIAETLNSQWDHVDLLFIRETNQHAVKKMVFEKSGRLSQFASEQLKLALELIKAIQPSLILVANACASDVLRDAVINDILFDDSYGCHFLRLNPNQKSPIFFSSMLTGQRALDKGSYERLKWHMGFVYKKIYG